MMSFNLEQAIDLETLLRESREDFGRSTDSIWLGKRIDRTPTFLRESE